MNKTKPITTKPKKYKDAPKPDIDELAKRWVEMLFETLAKKSDSRLGNRDFLTYADSRN